MRLALYEPDIPQNTGAMIRLGACLGVPLDIIEPCGFATSDKSLKRAAMDYADAAAITLHRSWAHFLEDKAPGRLVLLTTKADSGHLDQKFRRDDILLLGRESAGVPEAVHKAADVRLRIPMAAGARSLNVALAAAMVLGEALRQTGGFDRLDAVSERAQ